MRKHKSGIFSFALLLCAVCLPGCGYSQMTVVSDIEESFSGIREVELYGGPLEISYEGKDGVSDVALSAYLETNRDNGVKITYEVEGDKLIVKWDQSNKTNSWGSFRHVGYISLTGPKNMQLEVSSGSGKAFVSDIVSDELTVTAGSGHVEVNDLKVGQVYLSVGSGHIEAGNIKGNIDCKVSSGHADINDILGNINAVASSGKLSIENVEGELSAVVSSGKIAMDNIAAVGSLTSSSGSISGDNIGLGAATNLKCSSGSINFSTKSNLKDYNFDLVASSGSLRVGDEKKGKSLKIDNNSNMTVKGAVSSGSISIH
ncbi:DUF4097 family beta strand repeat protein [Echinicola marina]|uniref:DUF4097 family beta strand repeat-containing protein n=1 Tax=Echinicola marina TaxID=2859768 RepID=UPI001CF64F37|nr:DUF4097 family beta strand repeat-containing protein [Echinicola marina]UCS92583.1 DUF4097 family beta strand repeat protein [Echinicola marina]